MAHIPSEIENSISIDEDSEFDTSQETVSFAEHWPHAKNSLDCDVARLKAQNTNRLERRWDEIIAKYSRIDDDKESDEIDLKTGKITIDNGHLRSFADDGGVNGSRTVSSVWAIDDKFEKETRRQKHAEKLRRRLRLEEKQRLKASAMFYRPHMKVVDSGSDALEDNLSLLSPSPTKKHKSSSTSVSPSKPSLSIQKVNMLGYGHRLDTPNSSPLKEKLPSLAFSPSQSPLESPTRAGFDKSVFLSPIRPKLDPKSIPCLGVDHESGSDESYSGESYSEDDIPEDDIIDATDVGVDGLKHGNVESKDNEEDPDTEYDDSFSVLEICDPEPYAYFSCAFYGCRYTSQSKASYRAHLLSSHSPELRQIGYPVNTKTPYDHPLPGDTIPKLNVHFPLKIDPPPMRPHACNTKTEAGRCQKMFIDEKVFAKHMQQSPRMCSSKRQVFPCPLLGCDFMTDTSYEDFYKHMQTHPTRTLPEKKPEQKPEQKPKHSSENVSAEVTDYFSDSVSSISFSESEKEHTQDELLNKPKPTQTKPKSRQYWAPKKDNSLKNHTPKHLPCDSTLDKVPKLNILENQVNFDLDIHVETKEKDHGYSSIDELFQDDSS